MTAPATAVDVPWVHWRKVAHRLRQVWDPVQIGAHIAIYSKTRTGKSYLIVHVLLPLLAPARVIIFDAKGHDKVWRGIGREVTELPDDLTRGGGGPCGTWWRLVVNSDEDPDGAVRVMAAAFRRIAREGHVVVIIDEGLDLAGVREAVHKLLTKGGSHGVSVVICATSPQYAPPHMHRQWVAMLVGQMPDEWSHDRLAKVTGLPRNKELVRAIASVPRRAFLYVDLAGDVTVDDPAPVPVLAMLRAPGPEEIAS